MVSKKIKKIPSQVLGFVIFIQTFVKGTDENHKEEKINGFQELQEDEENALPSLGFVIFLQNFVKGTDENFKVKSRNGFQQDQEDTLASLGICDIYSNICQGNRWKSQGGKKKWFPRSSRI